MNKERPRPATGDERAATTKGRCHRSSPVAGRGRLLFIVFLIGWPTSAGHANPPGQAGQDLNRSARALSELRVEEAAASLDRVPARYATDPDVARMRALLELHRGDYVAAAAAIEVATVARPADPELRELRSLIGSTRDTTAGYVEARSADGRFVVRHATGADAVLVPYALETLRAADDVLTRELGVRVPGPVRLEIFPDPSALASVSHLSVEAIQRTGTIALCKWDRLMVTSPRALVRGYPWLDTVAHEYVHLVLSRASLDRAPVWFHEGMAKFFERRWRGEAPTAHLDPAALGLLTSAAREGTLLPFDRLHPSIALLPSQRDAALAFAQVATFIEMIHETHGSAGLRAIIERIAAGTDARDAIAGVAGSPFASLESRWQGRVRDMALPDDAPPLRAMRFRQGEGEVDESAEVTVDAAARFLRLGDLLWDRGRHVAAAAEYGKAQRAAPDDPIIASRLARAALAAGDGQRAADAIAPVLRRYPDHAPGHAMLASARLARGDLAGAREAAREAIRINPFDPQPHCDLAVAGGDDAERRAERRTCHALGGTVP